MPITDDIFLLSELALYECDSRVNVGDIYSIYINNGDSTNGQATDHTG